MSTSCLGRVSMLCIQVVTATATVQGKDMKPRGDQEEVVRSTARMTHCGHGQWRHGVLHLAVACYDLLHPARTEVIDLDVIYSSKTMIALQWEEWGSTKFNRTTCECVATVFFVVSNTF